MEMAYATGSMAKSMSENGNPGSDMVLDSGLPRIKKKLTLVNGRMGR